MTFKTMILRLALVPALLLMTAPGAGAQQPDFNKVEIKTTKVGDNLYAIEGQGGRIGVLTGPDGAFVVDSQFAPLTDRIVASIKQAADRPIRFLVNTHVHGDHTGGNENFAKMGVTILARPLLRTRLMKPSPPATGPAPAAAPAAALPLIIFDDPITLHLNGETIELIPLPVAHTDGDTAVRFPKVDVLMTGDVFRSVGYPNIDRANGGSLKGMLDAFDTLINLSGPNTKVLPGHGPITDRAGIVAHRDMVTAVRDRVAKLMKEKKTREQIVAAKVTTDYDERTGNAAQSADRFVGQLYTELGGAVTR